MAFLIIWLIILIGCSAYLMQSDGGDFIKLDDMAHPYNVTSRSNGRNETSLRYNSLGTLAIIYCIINFINSLFILLILFYICRLLSMDRKRL